MKKLAMILVPTAVVALSLALATGVSVAQDLKPWSDQPGERIAWDDFKKAPPDEEQTEDAYIRLKWSCDWQGPPCESWQEKPGLAVCTCHIQKTSSSTSMNRDESWVRQPASPELLNHERGHFDLAEKFRRKKLQPQLEDLECTLYSATGDTVDNACAEARSLADAALKAVFDEKWAQLEAAQADYDEKTQHGTDEAEQKAFKDEINKKLNLQDKDKDSIPDVDDNCPEDPNVSQLDEDRNGTGDVCQTDTDVDGAPDVEEARFGSDPLRADSTPEDLSYSAPACFDGQDNDGDGLLDGEDPGCLDQDLDWVSDAIDGCPIIADPRQEDSDDDGVGDACDADDDNDSLGDSIDNCPVEPNQDQGDQDNDGTGDACDWDLDGDGWEQFCLQDFCILSFDNCPYNFNPDQTDTDGDGVGDACDVMPVGGIVEIDASGSASAVNSAIDSSGGSSLRYCIALAGFAAVALLALTAGAWYARRRWLR